LREYLRAKAQMPNRALLWVAAAALLLLQLAPPAMATRLPPDTRKIVQEIFPAGNVRLDGSVELPDHSFLLPLVPSVNPLRRPLRRTPYKKFRQMRQSPIL